MFCTLRDQPYHDLDRLEKNCLQHLATVKQSHGVARVGNANICVHTLVVGSLAVSKWVWSGPTWSNQDHPMRSNLRRNWFYHDFDLPNDLGSTDEHRIRP